MKKLFITALLGAGVLFTLPSCNNGAYDADPNNSSGGLNPLDPNSGVTVYLGTMKATVSSTRTTYYPSYYRTIGDDVLMAYFFRAEDPSYSHSMGWKISGYNADKENFTVDPFYFVKDQASDSTIVYKIEMSSFKINGNEGGNYRGTFEGSCVRTGSFRWYVTVNSELPGNAFPDSYVPYSGKEERFEIKEGEFYIPEKKD